ncbi:MAG: hypothetical protein IJ037_09855, partial [Clostridia bacterium]|nr:hypothetical protein [Clostridia bacterium]
MENTGMGRLRIRVTAAGGNLPVRDAAVTVSEYTEGGDGELLYSLRTDEGGLTEIVTLPAPPASESMKPGAARPYALYNIDVSYPGFYPVEGVAVPVFDRITAVQPVNLYPLSEEDSLADAEHGRVMIYETPDVQSLQP